MLYEHEEDGNLIPDPSDIKTVQKETSEVVSLAYCDTIEYRKLHDNQAVKKPLTIPNWLNTLSERAGINFSTVLQEALKSKLDIQ